MDEDKLISMFADMAKGSEEGTGKLLLEKKADIKYILNRLIITAIIIIINLFVFKISIVVLVICIFVSAIALFFCWEDIYSFWSNKTMIKVYENGIEVRNRIERIKVKTGRVKAD